MAVITTMMSDTGGGTLLDKRVVPTDSGDHDRYSHYVKKDEMMRSAVEGVPVVALCGKVWHPNRDPEKYPLCPECKEIFDSLAV